MRRGHGRHDEDEAGEAECESHGTCGRADGGAVQRWVVKRDYLGHGETAIIHALPPHLWELAIIHALPHPARGNGQSGMGNRGGRPPHSAPHRFFFHRRFPALYHFPFPRFPIPDCPFPRAGWGRAWMIAHSHGRGGGRAWMIAHSHGRGGEAW